MRQDPTKNRAPIKYLTKTQILLTKKKMNQVTKKEEFVATVKSQDASSFIVIALKKDYFAKTVVA